MDPFEEFEFKPLTKGLGFHKKSAELKKQMLEGAAGAAPKSAHDLPGIEPSEFSEDDLVTKPHQPKTQEEAYADLLKALEKPMAFESKGQTDDLEISEALPRKTDSSLGFSSSVEAMDVALPDMSMPALPPMSEMPEIINEKESVTFEQKKEELFSKRKARGATNDPKSRALEPASVGIAAGILDSIFVVALSLIFLVSLILVTEVNISSLVFNSQTDLTTQISLGVLFFAVLQMYVIVARSFFGRTLGEWTFDMQLGSDDQHQMSTYPLRVLLRSLVTVVTGVVVLPVLSLLFRKDLAGSLSGLQLFRQKG